MHDQVHAAGVGIDADMLAQYVVQPAHRQCATFAIQFAHALDMPGKVTLRHKGGDDGLGQLRATTAKNLADTFKAPDLRLGHYQISQAYPRKQHLAEGAAVNYPPVAVQTLECRQRTADVAVLAVVIVFDNPGLLPAGPGQ